MRVRGTLAAVALGLGVALAGCERPEEAPRAKGVGGDDAVTTRAAGGRVEVQIDAPREALLGEPFDARARVVNGLDRSIVVVELVLRAAGETIARSDEPLRVPAGEGGRLVEGRYLVDEVGPQARMPAPSRWEWTRPDGARELITAPVLAPGETLTIGGRGRLASGSSALEAEARFAPIERAFRVERAALETAPPPPPAAGLRLGWVEAARTAIYLAPVAAPVGPDGARPYAWPGPDSLSLVPRPRIYPYFADVTAFPPEESATARADVATIRPAFDVLAARAKAGIARGPEVYLAPIRAWLFVDENGGRSVFVSADRRAEAPGDARALAAALMDRESVEVALSRGAPRADEGGMAGAFRARGLRASVREEKGGTYRGVVLVPRERLFDFVEEVGVQAAGGGLRIEGLSLSR